METLEKRKLHQSMLSRGPRNDGRIYFGVTTTGIYCRYPDLMEAFQHVRVPVAFDSFEVATSVILSQFVSTERSGENFKKLIFCYSEAVAELILEQLTHSFPSASLLHEVDFAGLGITQAHAAAIRELARLVDEGEIDLPQMSDLESMRAKLLAIKGIGPWTVEVIALRCLCDAKAFPAKDLIVARALEKFGFAADFFGPWRAYLALAICKIQGQLLTKKGKTT